MKNFLTVAVAFTFFMLAGSPVQQTNAATRGKLTGGLAHTIPDWFKDSFLDLAEDASEAAESNKHVLLFMTLNGCPYCSKMLNVVFAGDKDYIQKNFDSIAINIKGDRSVTPAGGEEMSEKDFARQQRVLFTPTIIFLDENAKQVYRINGFWNGKMFRSVMEFVSSKSYKTMTLPAFVKARAVQAKTKQAAYKFRAHPQLQTISDFSKVKKPLLVLFEDKDCKGCDKLHDANFNRPAIKEVLKTFVFARLDGYSSEPIVDINGNKTTAQAWAKSLKLTSRPGMVLFDEGKERQRIDGELYGYHFQNALTYVSGKHYKTFDNWLLYSSDRSEKLLKAGQNIDIGDRPIVGQ